MSTASFILKPEYISAIHWSSRGSCGEAGCPDPECCCSFCGGAIGLPDYDPRWHAHDENCTGCEICEDDIPAILFRGEGERTEQARFHWKCFDRISHFRSKAG